MGSVDPIDHGPDKSYMERSEPLVGSVEVTGGSVYQAEIWETRRIKQNHSIAEYVYWIMIVDPNFAGREILDTVQNEDSQMNVKFVELNMRNLEGFRFRHLAGSLFRIKFRMDLIQGKVINQDLTLVY